MSRYWGEASDLFFRRPILWLPVLVADLAGSGLDVAQKAIARAIVMRHLEYHSALGGVVQQHGLTYQAAQSATETAVAVAWTAYFVRILLYVVTAGLVWAAERRGGWAGAFAGLKQRASGAVFLALRLLAVYAFVAVGYSYLLRGLALHKSPLPGAMWFHIACAAVLVVLLVAVASGPALRLLEQREPGEHGMRSARGMALLMGLASLALTFFVGQSGGIMLRTTPGRRITLEILASLLTAIPYILMFLGFGVISGLERLHADDAPQVEAEV
jgi:hypothetical protein